MPEIIKCEACGQGRFPQDECSYCTKDKLIEVPNYKERANTLKCIVQDALNDILEDICLMTLQGATTTTINRKHRIGLRFAELVKKHHDMMKEYEG